MLTIDAYQKFYAANELGPRVEAELKHIDPDNPAALDSTAKTLQQLIMGGKVPDDLRTEIEQAYDALACDGTLCRRVAVRSSATAEDTAQFSFAGMFESYLNVFGKAGVVDAVKACWASTFGARVLVLSHQAGTANRNAGRGRRSAHGELGEIRRDVHVRPFDA